MLDFCYSLRYGYKYIFFLPFQQRCCGEAPECARPFVCTPYVVLGTCYTRGHPPRYPITKKEGKEVPGFQVELLDAAHAVITAVLHQIKKNQEKLSEKNSIQTDDTDLELVNVGDEGGQVVVGARGGEGAGHAAHHHLLAGEDVAGGDVLHNSIQTAVCSNSNFDVQR